MLTFILPHFGFRIEQTKQKQGLDWQTPFGTLKLIRQFADSEDRMTGKPNAFLNSFLRPSEPLISYLTF